MLALQEVMGIYHLDSRGSERRWLPLKPLNCETSLLEPLSLFLFFSPEYEEYKFLTFNYLN